MNFCINGKHLGLCKNEKKNNQNQKHSDINLRKKKKSFEMQTHFLKN